MTRKAKVKQKLKMYESMEKRSQRITLSEQKQTSYIEKGQKEKRCYNCSDKNHVCQNKERGVERFKCNEYDHIAANCLNTSEKQKTRNYGITRVGMNQTKRHKNIITNRRRISALIDFRQRLV